MLLQHNNINSDICLGYFIVVCWSLEKSRFSWRIQWFKPVFRVRQTCVCAKWFTCWQAGRVLVFGEYNFISKQKKTTWLHKIIAISDFIIAWNLISVAGKSGSSRCCWSSISYQGHCLFSRSLWKQSLQDLYPVFNVFFYRPLRGSETNRAGLQVFVDWRNLSVTKDWLSPTNLIECINFRFSERNSTDKRAFIILGFKTLDTGFSSVLESTWRDWTGARAIYLKLHNQFDLSKWVEHTYIVYYYVL